MRRLSKTFKLSIANNLANKILIQQRVVRIAMRVARMIFAANDAYADIKDIIVGLLGDSHRDDVLAIGVKEKVFGKKNALIIKIKFENDNLIANAINEFGNNVLKKYSEVLEGKVGKDVSDKNSMIFVCWGKVGSLTHMASAMTNKLKSLKDEKIVFGDIKPETQGSQPQQNAQQSQQEEDVSQEAKPSKITNANIVEVINAFVKKYPDERKKIIDIAVSLQRRNPRLTREQALQSAYNERFKEVVKDGEQK